MPTWRNKGFSMAVPGLVLPRGYRIVVMTLGLGATVLVLLLAFRILAGLAYWVGSFAVLALFVSGTVIQLRWNAKVKRLRHG
jgi:hypothetical protein